MQEKSSVKARAVHWLMAAVLLLTPLFAHALGLGKLVVRSGLDEPLNGEIELLSATSQEIKTLKSSLAPRADFDSAGIELPFFLTGIKYNVIQRDDGRSFLTLSTDEPVREPFLHLLLQVEWSGGKLIREYTALLDPPQWAAGSPPDIQTPEVPGEISDADLVPDPASTLAQAPATETLPVPGEPTADTLPPAPMEPAMAEPAPTPTVVPEPESTVAKASEPTPVPEAAPAPSPTDTASVPEPADSAATLSPEASLPAPPSESPADAPVMAPAMPEPADPGFTPESNVRAWASAWEYGPIKKGETLGQISEKLRNDKTLTSKQVMLALLRANPSAFYGKNVNNLKTGMILKVPEREDVETVSKDLAAREFQAQYEVWQKYKLKVANANSVVTVPSEDTQPATVAKSEPAPETPAKASPPTKSAKSATPAPKGSSTAAKTAKGGDDDLLKIVRSSLDEKTVPEGAKAPGVETRKDAAKEQRALTEKVATLEEAIESKDLQNKEMRDRLGKMQEQVKNTSRLIDLENKDLAQAQKQATDSAKTKLAQVPAPEPAPTSAQAVPVSPTEPPKTEAPPAEPQPQASTPPSNLPAMKTPKARPPAALPPPTAEEPSMLTSFLEGITDNSFLLPVIVVVGVLGGGILAMYYVRRRRASAEFEESILSGGGHGTDSSSISNSATQPGASDTSFLSDFSQGGMGNIHTDEVDPIAEAEVYLAYGRDEQAEEILKEAVVKDPARHELKQKLLEIYHQRNDVGAFETLAEELYAALEGKGGKVWDKVEEMGRKISPKNPMFRGGAPAAGGRGSNTYASIQNEVALDGGGVAPDNNSLGFEMDEMLHTPPAARESTESMGTGLDFDLGESTAPASTANAPDLDFNFNENVDHRGQASNNIDFGSASSTTTDDHEISLDFDMPSAAPTAQDEGLSFASDTTHNSGLEFESASTTSDADVALEEPQWDETATKLDLAKAYIDMGDAEGARSILDEVLAEGNESQKEQARDLATQIA